MAAAAGGRLLGQFLLHGLWLVFLSLCGIFLLGAEFYQNWFGFIAISCIPALVIINAVWEFRYPDRLAGVRTQPWRGLGFTLLAVLPGLLLAYLSFNLVGAAIAPPAPFLMMFIILSVVVVMWQLLVFEGWPFVRLGRYLQGWAMLATAYLLAYCLYAVFFDFSLLTGLPASWYALAPRGLFEPWSAIVYAITTLAVLFALQLLEFRPFSLLKARPWWPARQPVYGLLVGGFTLLLSLLIFWLATGYFALDPVVFMVGGPVSFLFGLFLLQDTTANRVLVAMAQPARGLLLIVISMLLGVLLCRVYGWFMLSIAGQIASGPPGYSAELWLANAMLSMTFPLILIYCHFFSFWPLAGLYSVRGAGNLS